MTRGVTPPRSTVRGHGWLATNLTVLVVVVVTLVASIVISLVCFAVTASPLIVLAFGFMAAGQIFVAVAYAACRAPPSMISRLADLTPGVVGQDGEVAMIEGEVVPGAEGMVTAPLSRRRCVWAVVATDTDGEKPVQTSKDTATTFQLKDDAGRLTEVEPTCGELMFVGGAIEASEAAKDAWARKLGIPVDGTVFTERALLPGTRVLVVGVVQRGAARGRTAYRGEDLPTLTSDATTRLTVFGRSRAELLEATTPGVSIVGAAWFIPGIIALCLAGNLYYSALTN